MRQLNTRELKSMIKFVAFQQREPLFIWGQPGAAKSSTVSQVCEAEGAFFCDIRLGQYDSVDIRGMPDVNTEAKETVWYPPSTLPFKGNKVFEDLDNDTILLFFDEMNGASPSVSGVAYQIVNDRRCGEHELMDNVIIVAAGNREGDKGVTLKQPLPLANRFTHVEAEIDLDVWVHDHAIPNDLSSIGIAFLLFRKPLISTFDPAKQDKAFATPRTWDKALRYLDAPGVDEPTRWAAISGAVGEGVATELQAFAGMYEKMISIEDIIADPIGTPVPDATDMSYAMAVAISGSMNAQTTAPLYQYLRRMSAEYVVCAWKLAMGRDPSVVATPEFLDFSKAYKSLFTAA